MNSFNSLFRGTKVSERLPESSVANLLLVLISSNSKIRRKTEEKNKEVHYGALIQEDSSHCLRSKRSRTLQSLFDPT